MPNGIEGRRRDKEGKEGGDVTEKQDLPGWLKGICNKRTDVFMVLAKMVEVGIEKGVVTAEDAHCIPATPNSRGAAAKFMTKFGFRKGEVFKGTTKQSHGHWLCKWYLEDHSKAKGFLDAVKGLAITIPPVGTLRQGELL